MKGRHFFVPLEFGNPLYYASCNILNDDSLLYVYLLHPKRGSLVFTLIFEKNTTQYKPRHIVPGLDKITIALINEKINEETELPGLYAPNYRLIETGDQYGYLVINRRFAKDGDTISPIGQFHVFHEGWESYNEYEWNEDGLVSVQGNSPGEKETRLINDAIKEMNAA